MNRRDFPILKDMVHGHPLVYLDNAASAQRPQSVVDTWTQSVLAGNANIHRAVHYLAGVATEAYEGARDCVQAFLNAFSREEIVFTSGATAAVNLVASSFGQMLENGDEIIVTVMEHHRPLGIFP